MMRLVFEMQHLHSSIFYFGSMPINITVTYLAKCFKYCKEVSNYTKNKILIGTFFSFPENVEFIEIVPFNS